METTGLHHCNLFWMWRRIWESTSSNLNLSVSVSAWSLDAELELLRGHMDVSVLRPLWLSLKTNVRTDKVRPECSMRPPLKASLTFHPGSTYAVILPGPPTLHSDSSTALLKCHKP